jgi:hypothetical protein
MKLSASSELDSKDRKKVSKGEGGEYEEDAKLEDKGNLNETRKKKREEEMVNRPKIHSIRKNKIKWEES